MNLFILILIGIISAMATYILSVKLKQGAVRSSAILSLVIGLFFYFYPDLLSDYLTKNIPLVFIGASFIGMTSPKIFSNLFIIAISGAVFSLIYLNTSMFFSGYGGVLGTTACISVLISFGLNVYINKIKNIRHIHNF